METISFRLEDKEKERLKEIFEEMGLDLSTGMRLYVKRVLTTRSIPFELSASNRFEQSLSDYERGDVTRVKDTKDLMASLNAED
ncbi:type II toxin-antitoxin system RelB/DinJ family antitoxin [Enterococcus sp. LJL98]